MTVHQKIVPHLLIYAIIRLTMAFTSLFFKGRRTTMYTIDFNNPIRVHFIGIGGISMSGLAEILIKEGFKVTGSDMKASEITNELSEMGALINIGQYASNINDNIDLVIYTAAIRQDNEEFQAAKNAGIPMLTRAQLLGQIMANYKYSVAVSGPTARQQPPQCSLS